MYRLWIKHLRFSGLPEYSYDAFVQVDDRLRRSNDESLAIASALRQLWHGVRQVDVAQRLTDAGMLTDQSKVSAWSNGRVPSFQQMNTIEQTFGKPRGWILARAGFVDVLGLVAETAADGLVASPQLPAVIAHLTEAMALATPAVARPQRKRS